MSSQPLIITRIFDAPREKVWDAWTNPEMMKKWWGPATYTAPFITIDLRVGGKYHFCMRGKMAPGGPDQDFWSTGTYREIIENEKLVCTDSFSNEKGEIVSAEEFGMSGFPLECLVTVTFEDTDDGKTKMTLTHEGIPEGQMGDMTSQGWQSSFDKLEAALA